MRTITVTCPSCHKTLEADESNAGMTVECPLCHLQFEIPGPAPVAATPQENAPAATPQPPQQPPVVMPQPPQGYGYAPQGYGYAPQSYGYAPQMPQGYVPQGYAPGYPAVPPGYAAGPRRAISWTAALVCGAVCLALNVLFSIVSFMNENSNYVSESDEVLEGVLAIGLFVAWILDVVFSMILHYKCWKALPWPFNNVSAVGPVTPGKAVGFLFIPFFNLYWLFPSYAGLGKAWNNWAVATGKVAPTHPQQPPKTAMPALGMALAVLALLSWVLGWIPFVDIPLNLACFVLWIFLYKNVVRYANSPDAWPV